MIPSSSINDIFRYLSVKGVGLVKTNKLLLDAAGSKQSVSGQLLRSSLNREQQRQYDEALNLNLPNSIGGEAVNYLTIIDDKYPQMLARGMSANAPTILSYMGNLDLLRKRTIVFSGSRKVSEKGIMITRDMVDELSSITDICVVAGYAAGVDRTALRSALERGLSSIVVLPEGICHFSIRQELRDVWDWNRVLVLSQFKPSENWSVSNAMLRNNTIISLSHVIVIIEAGEHGGSFDAGIKSIEKGKQLFVPYYKEAPESALGNNVLIRRGAIPLKMAAATRRPNISKVRESLMSEPDLF